MVEGRGALVVGRSRSIDRTCLPLAGADAYALAIGRREIVAFSPEHGGSLGRAQSVVS